LSIDPPRTPEEGPTAQRPLFNKAEVALESHKLDITKAWLGRLILQIEDLSTLEAFPTQESIRISVELIEGIAAVMRDDGMIREFQPGGRYYVRAAELGAIGNGSRGELVSLSQSLLALESSIWELLVETLRKEDRDLLEMVVRLRQALHGITTASTEAYFIRSNDELDRLAHTDSLTGLYNRRFLVQELDRHVEMFKRYHHPFSLLMLDLDNLKPLNDTHGHAVGDAAIRHFSLLLKMNVRDVDIPCRYGGDEFVVLMPETDKTMVETVGRRIAESLHKTKLKAGSTLITLRVSVGHSACPEDGQEGEELLQVADATLYQAKEYRLTGLPQSGNP
jgi:diguanylate cyclase (GGDEF)-like protein